MRLGTCEGDIQYLVMNRIVNMHSVRQIENEDKPKCSADCLHIQFIHTELMLYSIFIFAPGVFVGEDCEARRALDADEVVGDNLQHHPPLVHVYGLQVQT